MEDATQLRQLIASHCNVLFVLELSFFACYCLSSLVIANHSAQRVAKSCKRTLESLLEQKCVACFWCGLQEPKSFGALNVQDA